MVLSCYMFQYNSAKCISPEYQKHVFGGTSALLLLSLIFFGVAHAQHPNKYYIYGWLGLIYICTELYFYYYYNGTNSEIIEDDVLTAFIMLGWVCLMLTANTHSRVRVVSTVIAITTITVLHYIVPMYTEHMFDHALYMGLLWAWLFVLAYQRTI